MDVGSSGSHSSCCERTNVWYGLQCLHLRILLADSYQTPINVIDVFLKLVDAYELLQHAFSNNRR
jgi:hypothetical protein